ncbi:NRAMP family divalent metal transporter [Spongisporangium articulatum]|uniref:NRAMP family divalent metal transporter n=1 Tax=Spongisporangium articulatum TaxID=3362603 RepID=A0ABW8AGH1_9ACTN
MKPSKVFAFTLGTLSAIGGFIDIGDLVADALVGARFGLRLAWVTVLAVIGIMCYAEMSGRIVAVTKRPAFDLARSRLGPRYGLVALVGSFLVTGLLVMAELSGIALSFQLVTDISYLFWIPLATALVAVSLWALPFEVLERLYGILGLSMLVFVVAVWQLHPDWGDLWHSATTVAPTAGETWPVYAFFAITLIGAQMTPYEMFFFSSGGVEHGWGPKSLGEMRTNVLIGFPLGGLLAIAIQAAAYVVYYPAGIEVSHISQTALPVVVALGKVGLALAAIGIFAATFGATMETLFATGYDVAQYFGWSYGKVRPPAQTARFTTVAGALLLVSAALALTTLDPIRVTIVAVVFSAMLLPLSLLPPLLVGNDETVMGRYRNGRLSNGVGVVTLALTCLVSLAALPLLILTRGGAG